jgi:tripeptidyl-peptidase-1
MQPSPQSIAALNAFASDNGLNVTTGNGHGEWMSFTANVSHANTLFAASFQQFQHVDTATPIMRTLSYSLPLSLSNHVDTVHPMTTFDTSFSRRNTFSAARTFTKRQQNNSVPPVPIAPASLQLLYNIPVGTKDPAGISIGIAGYGGDAPQINDTAVSACNARILKMKLMECTYRHFYRSFGRISLQTRQSM